MHSNGFSDDQAIADQLPDCLSGIRILDFIAFGGVKPDLALAAAND